MTKKLAPLVVALAYDGLCTFEFGIAVEVFGQSRPEFAQPLYRFAVAAIEPGRLRALGGVELRVAGGLELLRGAHTIVVPGWRSADALPPRALIDALQKAMRRGARIVSICSGVFVLAHAGLLDGRRATTHWKYAQILAERFPAIEVAPDVLYVDGGNILTSAGSAAGIDVLLHVVRLDHGARIANLVARRLVVAPHREGGQAQFVMQPMAIDQYDRMAGVVDWMAANLHRQIDLPMLAKRASTSVRNFTRKFRAAAGVSAMEWLIRLRVRRAQELLESTRDPLERIAERTGFAASETLRHHFRRVVGTSPRAWRKAFRDERK
jgi:AraC family transcriptional regulator, transcriptional activator FtrA